jgi:hypothetical protein
MIRFIVLLVQVSIVTFGLDSDFAASATSANAQVTTVTEEYDLHVSYSYNYTIARGPVHSEHGTDVFQKIPVRVLKNLGSISDSQLYMSPVFLNRGICSRTSPGVPSEMKFFGTTSYQIPDDLFTRVRGASLFTRLEEYNSSTGEFRAVVSCSWLYSGGGSGSFDVQISGRPVSLQELKNPINSILDLPPCLKINASDAAAFPNGEDRYTRFCLKEIGELETLGKRVIQGVLQAELTTYSLGSWETRTYDMPFELNVSASRGGFFSYRWALRLPSRLPNVQHDISVGLALSDRRPVLYANADYRQRIGTGELYYKLRYESEP